MQYQVPQFIEIEDKIFGPLTLKQFIYLAAAGGISLICISLLPLYFAIPAAIPFIIVAMALAFYKVNEQPLIIAVEHAFAYFLSNKLYLWKQHVPEDPSEIPVQVVAHATPLAPELSEHKLKDLAWSLNIKDASRAGVVDPDRPLHSRQS